MTAQNLLFDVGGNAAFMLLRAADRFPERTAIVESDGRCATFVELRGASLAIAELIGKVGLGAGDRVGILLERGVSSAAAYFGVLASGAVAVPINESLRLRQIDYILSHSGAQLLVTSGNLLARLPRGLLAHVETLDINDVAALPPAESRAIAGRIGGDMAHIIYTSGSTGMPKGVVVSHANVWAGAIAVVSYLGIRKDDRIASLLPFSFDYGLNQLLCSALTGATLVVERTPVAPRIVETLLHEAVTVLPAVPPLWLQLLNVERFRSGIVASLRILTNTGGRLPREAVCQLRTSYADAKLFLMYGLTEAFRSAFLAPDKVDRKPDSIGSAIPGAELFVLRDDLTPCAPNEVGQLVHRGTTVALGYWNHPEATADRFQSNPLRPAGTPDPERVVFSGDLVRRDEEGDLYFVGRRDAMIKSLGHRVSPDEVTDVLYASGEIVEAVVAAEPDAMRGDAIVAFVVLKDGGDLDRLQQYAARELPRYMQPVRYEIRAELERTSSGKHDAKAVAAAAGAGR